MVSILWKTPIKWKQGDCSFFDAISNIIIQVMILLLYYFFLNTSNYIAFIELHGMAQKPIKRSSSSGKLSGIALEPY